MLELDDFFPTYRALLVAGDADALGALYTPTAVLTGTGGPEGTSWAVGRAQIVAQLAAALQQYQVLDETPPDVPFEVRDDGRHAARFGTFRSRIVPRSGGPTSVLTVEAFEVLARSATDGWRYLTDQSRVVSVTTPPPGP